MTNKKMNNKNTIEFLKRRLLWMVRCIPGRSVHALRPEPQRHLLLKARVYRVLCPSALAGEAIELSLPAITSGAAHDQLPTQHQRVIELLKRRLWLLRRDPFSLVR
jgi:hypothetical protein